MADVRAVAVLASEVACDRIEGLPGSFRIAPTEVMLLGDVSIDVLQRAVRAVDPDALLLDVSDGWALVRLEGARAREAFARLSELRLPLEGFVQGEVARIGARVLVHRDGIDLLVPAMLEAHVRTRVELDCRGLLA